MSVVLLGGGGTGTAFAIAGRLRASWGMDIRLVVTDIFEAKLVTTSLLADAFHTVPRADDPAFEAALRDIMTSENITTYIPILNDEIKLAAILAGEDAFAHVDIWSSEKHAFLTDKRNADDWLNGIGVRTPRRFDRNGTHEPADEWFAKPLSGFGGKGVRRITVADLMALGEAELAGLLVQEVCSGPEVTVDSFFNHETGEGLAYCRERLEVKAGVCTKARLFHDAVLEDYARKIGAALGQKGAICFQVMKGTGGWAVTDLNLRTGAGTAMTCAAGFDILSAAYACRTGRDYGKYLPAAAHSEDVVVTRQYCEFVMG
ncbi:ATP-grasp domain-containing protein [Eilatimonas milleporae]|uniref:ATP-grasp domain-containing protein n=1 Tax=Eilatimonas milleporae TaxID=911205 RepID=A0A3M0CIF7_9PROT|nr:ATP-grasp domain-containing protein [Eilatimonas milleporae]RMB08615.1 ATP-grasp domain-containing protein [Eilatimonas milleporae]